MPGNLHDEMTKRQVSYYLDPTLIRRIGFIAEWTNTTRSVVVETLLEQAVAAHEKVLAKDGFPVAK